ncbi:uncharacterized protein LOC128218711 [Mya arenaria]|uniref:uncharacterized protein LOC128218711 n=1 Tax=Mya arenaria TaxID=6604 RepID=UPI0022E59827|nr:uncharacterized protein LOC128218711 [Mya arenaria]
MLRFLLLGLCVSVFVLLPSVKADDELTDQKILEAVERALDRQLKDREVQQTDDTDSNTVDCGGEVECCFHQCDGDLNCSLNCILKDDEDNQESKKETRRRWWHYNHKNGNPVG